MYSLHSRCSERLIVYRLFEIKSHIDCAILLRAITKLKAATPPFDTKECGGPYICSQQTNGFRADRTVDLLQSTAVKVRWSIFYSCHILVGLYDLHTPTMLLLRSLSFLELSLELFSHDRISSSF